MLNDESSNPTLPGTVPVPVANNNGRTLSDLFYLGRFYILIAIVLIALTVAAMLGYVSIDVGGILSEYWPAIVAPVIGYFVTGWIMPHLYEPRYITIFRVDPVDRRIAEWKVPEERYALIERTGTPAVLYTDFGEQLIPVENFSEASAEDPVDRVEFGWYEEYSPIEILAAATVFDKFAKDLTNTKIENRIIHKIPDVLGHQGAKKGIQDFLDLLLKPVEDIENEVKTKEQTEGAKNEGT